MGFRLGHSCFIMDLSDSTTWTLLAVRAVRAVRALNLATVALFHPISVLWATIREMFPKYSPT